MEEKVFSGEGRLIAKMFSDCIHGGKLLFALSVYQSAQSRLLNQVSERISSLLNVMKSQSQNSHTNIFHIQLYLKTNFSHIYSKEYLIEFLQMIFFRSCVSLIWLLVSINQMISWVDIIRGRERKFLLAVYFQLWQFVAFKKYQRY